MNRISENMNVTVGLGILTMNRPHVLERTLESYKEHGFLRLFDQTIILLQGNNPEERAIAEKFNLTVYSTDDNIGIGPGNNYLIDKLATDYFIICQNDFKLVDSNFSQIVNGIKMIQSGLLHCMKLRSNKNPGEPAHGSRCLINPEGGLGPTHHCCLLYYNFITEPHKDNRYKSVFHYVPEYNCHVISSKHACYTENPCLFERDWYIKTIYSFNQIDGRLAENNVQQFWENQDFQVGMGEGLFCHDDT